MTAKPVEDFAAEADDARLRIASTIDAIQDRLDPRRILGDAVSRATTGGAQLVGKAGDTAKAHPYAIGAAVAAIGLALLARNRLSKATVNLGDDLGDYTDYDDGFGFAEAAPASAYDDGRFGDMDDDYDVIGEDRAAGRPLAARAGDSVAANPLTAIVIGLAAGAALGALFPATDTERRALGETGQKLGAAARAAARRAQDELDAAGLSVESVKARAGEVSRKARGAARAVADAARDEFKAK